MLSVDADSTDPDDNSTDLHKEITTRMMFHNIEIPDNLTVSDNGDICTISSGEWSLQIKFDPDMDQYYILDSKGARISTHAYFSNAVLKAVKILTA